MAGRRKRHGARFEARVALEALRGELTAARPAARHGVHQAMAGEWRKQAAEGLAALSGKEAARDAARPSEAGVERLRARIGRLVAERGFLAKVPGRWAWSGGAAQACRRPRCWRWRSKERPAPPGTAAPARAAPKGAGPAAPGWASAGQVP